MQNREKKWFSFSAMGIGFANIKQEIRLEQMQLLVIVSSRLILIQ